MAEPEGAAPGLLQRCDVPVRQGEVSQLRDPPAAAVQHDDAVVAGVRDEQSPAGVQRDVVGIRQSPAVASRGGRGRWTPTRHPMSSSTTRLFPVSATIRRPSGVARTSCGSLKVERSGPPPISAMTFDSVVSDDEDPVVSAVGDDRAAVRSAEGAPRPEEVLGGSAPEVPEQAGVPVSLHDSVVVRVGDEIAAAAEPLRRAGRGQAPGGDRTRAERPDDLPVPVELEHAKVVGVGDHEAAAGHSSGAPGHAQPRRLTGHAVTPRPFPGHRAVGRELHHAVVSRVAHEDASRPRPPRAWTGWRSGPARCPVSRRSRPGGPPAHWA